MVRGNRLEEQKLTSLLAKLYIELALSKELPSATVAVVDVAEGAVLEGKNGDLDHELVIADPVPVVPVPVDVLAVM